MVDRARGTVTGPMMWFFAILVVLAMGGVAVVAAGRGAPMADGVRRPAGRAGPADGPLRAEDLRRVRFSLAFRGYRMSEVDALLDRLATSWRRPRRNPETPTSVHERRRRGHRERRGERPDRLGHTSARVARRDRLRPDRPGGGGGGADPAPDARRAGRRPRPRRQRLLNLHTVAGVLALVVWVLFLVAPERHARSAAAPWASSALGLFWIVTVGRPADPGPLAAQPRPARVRGPCRTPGPRARVCRCWPTSACSSGWASSPSPT